MPSPTPLIELRDAIAAGATRAEDATRAAIERIDRAEAGGLGAFLHLFRDDAVDRARAVDAAIERGEPVGPLAGVPVALKDNICLDRGPTTAASRILAGFRSPFSATAAARLEAAGAIVVGKANLDEFAMGSSGEHSAAGPTRNPWSRDHVPGGSSSGSAAAVAARLVPAALGSDTGGSIRQPAAYTGVVGLKPTYGRVSRLGLIAFASSLDQIGPLATSVPDAALLFDAIAGRDPRDSTCADLDHPAALAALERPVTGLRLGVPRELRDIDNHPDVADAFDAALDTFRTLGADLVDVSLPNLAHGVTAYYLVAPAEASSNLARYDGVRYGRRAEHRPGDTLDDLYARSRAEGFGPEVKRRIILGTYALSAGYYDAYYNTALKARRLIKRDFDRCFDPAEHACHAVLTPAAPTPAFKLGEMHGDPEAMYAQDVYTVLANMAGIPAISVPMGMSTRAGATLPMGLQLTGPAFDESTLLRAARMYENATDHALRTPSDAEKDSSPQRHRGGAEGHRGRES